MTAAYREVHPAGGRRGGAREIPAPRARRPADRARRPAGDDAGAPSPDAVRGRVADRSWRSVHVGRLRIGRGRRRGRSAEDEVILTARPCGRGGLEHPVRASLVELAMSSKSWPARRRWHVPRTGRSTGDQGVVCAWPQRGHDVLTMPPCRGRHSLDEGLGARWAWPRMWLASWEQGRLDKRSELEVAMAQPYALLYFLTASDVSGRKCGSRYYA
mmetsp:Transcript_6145/g.13473  ORF Transcript_6145/g.13473 Transcript_6145/m.13473 type:complete len:215 (+) Transcript_6145:271-915(+)